MTPELTADSPGEAPKQIPSTAGMTTKVFKGSMWTLAGTVLPLGVSFVTTPIIIRLLGSEAYGVLLLVGLIPAYLSFADFGMGLASTRFASKAYGEGDAQLEKSYVRNAVTICSAISGALLLPIFIFAAKIVPLFSVPPELQTEATVALRISTIAFFLSIPSSVVNGPQLARLRMDLSSAATAGPKIAMALATPVVLYFGGGIAEAVWLGLAAAIFSLLLNAYFTARLLPGIWGGQLDLSLMRPLIDFGGGWFLASIAATLLANMEKLILAKFISVEALAHYSVAFTLAGMVTLFSIAMRQSLLPAFAQLSHADKRLELESLVKRGLRLMVSALVPVLILLCVIARPFFTFWAGEEFGRESTVPFYILALGLFFSIVAYVPHSVITARGRTDFFARIYWIEFFLYAMIATSLIYLYGLLGAATAWSLRVLIDSLVILFFAKRIGSISFGLSKCMQVLGGAFLIMLPLVVVAIYNNFSIVLLFLLPLSICGYLLFVWYRVFDNAERLWFRNRLSFLGFWVS